MFGTSRRIAGVTVGATVALLMCLTASQAWALVAPVSAGPPKPPRAAHLDFDGFFPSTTRIHVGDSVSWAINGFHTVTFLAKGQAPPPLIVLFPASPISGQARRCRRLVLVQRPAEPGSSTRVAAAPSGGKTYNGKGFLNSGLPRRPGTARTVRGEVHEGRDVHVPLPGAPGHEGRREGAAEGQAACPRPSRTAALAKRRSRRRSSRRAGCAKVKPPAGHGARRQRRQRAGGVASLLPART